MLEYLFWYSVEEAMIKTSQDIRKVTIFIFELFAKTNHSTRLSSSKVVRISTKNTQVVLFIYK